MYERNRSLQLPEYPIRSVTTLHEDTNALGGSVSGSFGASTLLTEGTDFFIDINQSGLGMSGRLVRYNNTWPFDTGSIKVVYVAGWDNDELTGNVTDPRLDASDFQVAVMRTIAEAFADAKQGRAASGGSGALKSERLLDWSATYDTSTSGAKINIPPDVKKMLASFRRIVVG